VIRAAVVGLGFGARVHVPGLRSLEGVEVVAVCARHGADAVAERLGVARAYASWNELLAEEALDLLTVAAPPGVQAEIARAALERRLPVLCEKPLGRTADEAAALAELAAEAGVPTLVDFEFRAIPAFARAHELLAAGELGRPTRAEIVWTVGTRAGGPLPPSWKDRDELGGGALLALGVHAFDYLGWLVGPIRAVAGRVDVVEGSSDTGCVAELELRDGVAATVTVSTAAAEPRGHRVRIECEGGTVEIENADLSDWMSGFELRAPGVSIAPSESAGDGRIAPFAALASSLVEAIRTSGAAEPSFAAGARAHAVAAALRASGGKRLELPL
jgi:predicted dehydrogenase